MSFKNDGNYKLALNENEIKCDETRNEISININVNVNFNK